MAIKTDLQAFVRQLKLLFYNGVLPIAQSRREYFKRGEPSLIALENLIEALERFENALRTDSPPAGNEKDMKAHLDTEYSGNPLFFTKIGISERGFINKKDVIIADKMTKDEALRMMVRREIT